MQATYKRRQPVRLLSFTGATFDRDWSQKGTIVRHDAGFQDGHWYIVKYDDGGTLCVHTSRLMPSNS